MARKIIGYLLIDDSDGETEFFNLAESCKQYMNENYLEFPRLYALHQKDTAASNLSVAKYGIHFNSMERMDIPKGWRFKETE